MRKGYVMPESNTYSTLLWEGDNRNNYRYVYVQAKNKPQAREFLQRKWPNEKFLSIFKKQDSKNKHWPIGTLVIEKQTRTY